MHQYFCTAIDSVNNCLQWTENSAYTALSTMSVDDGIKLGGMFFALAASAWCGRLLLNVLRGYL